MKRRGFLFASMAAACALASGVAFAGSYLDRAALMLETGKREADAIKTRTGDKEMLLVVKASTEARVKVARKMNVPAAVVDAHPHLLLVLENHERAAEAAKDGNPQRFLVYHQRARDEERVLRGVLKQLGFPLPGK